VRNSRSADHHSRLFDSIGTLLVTSNEAGIPLPYIRDILGHVDLSTTEIYARASTEAKRRALEAAYTDIVTDDLPEWNQDPGLLNWLATL
jgi:integrase/recombinase XerD